MAQSIKKKAKTDHTGAKPPPQSISDSWVQTSNMADFGGAQSTLDSGTVVGLALVVAFFITGHGFSTFDKTLKQCLGISTVTKNRYYEVIKLINPIIADILNEMCEEEKERMKRIEGTELGSWERAVTSDGVWQTRGYFSKNGSFIIKNYLTGGLVWYGHKCMKGGDDLIEDELFEGTSKSMEGVLAGECYKQAKDEGCCVEVVWQDADSSSANAVAEHHPGGKVYKCGGHVGRAHTNNLKEAAKRKSFSATMIAKHKAEYPEIEKAKCGCKRHKKGCGCLSDAFIKAAKINHFCCLQQCKDPKEYARRMRALANHHCKNEHVWNHGKENCGFHLEKQCSCKGCDDDEELKCEGVAYQTKNVLKCNYHWLEYKIECERRANDASSVIHPEMGRGQSNLCEAHFNVLPHFRSKSQNLC
ncbi:uncharacterized protein LOC110243876, partial [Exaiptasia diaphana]|uniref:Uncharacterized protein n=1 Tax=Exaiptasia diaphana TaxID=2652724 RepID=A0A913YQ37_EXADI